MNEKEQSKKDLRQRCCLLRPIHSIINFVQKGLSRFFFSVCSLLNGFLALSCNVSLTIDVLSLNSFLAILRSETRFLYFYAVCCNVNT